VHGLEGVAPGAASHVLNRSHCSHEQQKDRVPYL
jgi:hypothetical protein